MDRYSIPTDWTNISDRKPDDEAIIVENGLRDNLLLHRNNQSRNKVIVPEAPKVGLLLNSGAKL